MSTSAATFGCSSPVAGEFMLFGVRVVVADPMRKCVSLNNLSEYQHPPEMADNKDDVAWVIRDGGDGNKEEVACGYVSADEAGHRAGTGNGVRERKRGVPWTEDEHKMFLVGLQKVGKGDWRGISRNYVQTRTPIQVASHAQKYFLRRSNINRRRRRSSLFDITTDTVAAATVEKDEIPNQDAPTQLHSSPRESLPTSETCIASGFHPISTFQPPIAAALPVSPHYPYVRNIIDNHSANPVSPVPFIPAVSHTAAMPDHESSKAKLVSMDSPSLSLNLFTGSNKTDPVSRQSAFQVLSSFGNGDNLLTVA